jgi:branched-chain amino acid transport system permease protein
VNFSTLSQFFFSGLAYGAVYAVIALGFNIVYNSTGIINFAQGEFVMLGGMITQSLSKLLPLPFAILGAVAITACVGAVLELAFIRRLSKRAKSSVMQLTIMTIGLSMLLKEIALKLWGEQVKTVPFFSGSEVSSLALAGAHFSPQLLWIMGATALIVVALSLFYRYTLTGQAMRACSASRVGSRLCGIRPEAMVNLSFTLAAVIGAAAGAVTAPLTQAHYAIGTGLAIKGFTVAVFGGLGNSAAAVASGFIIGILESFSIIVVPEAFKDIVTIAILLAVLVTRPAGLFGSREAGRLKEF